MNKKEGEHITLLVNKVDEMSYQLDALQKQLKDDQRTVMLQPVDNNVPTILTIITAALIGIITFLVCATMMYYFYM